MFIFFKFSSAQTNTFPENGNVGIGTATPTDKLHLFGGVNITNPLANNQFLKLYISGAVGFIDGGEGALSMIYKGVQHIWQNPSGQESMRIHPNGNVGIGTTSPSSPLEIRKNGELLKLSDEGPNQETSMTYLNTSYGLWQTGVNATGGGSWWIYKSGYGYLMNFMSNGNVGIGTADPKGYKLAVNGKIRSQEIKVEAANWPDYVFAKSYQLPSLQETEKHIKENGHLAGIPSAAEVKSNGIDLGEMNAKLLQKIEELTLYLIEQDKINKEQNQIILELIKRIDNQKNK